jgi:hypothetical protein
MVMAEQFETSDLPELEALRLACNSLGATMSSMAAETVIEKAFAESDIPEVHIIQLGDCENNPVFTEETK